MPIVGVAHSPATFWGLPTAGVLATDDPPVVLPRGFDAVAQFDQRLLQAQLGRTLFEAGLTALRVKFALDAEGLPPAVGEAAASHIGPLTIAGLDETMFELRLVGARLVTLGHSNAPTPPAGNSGAVMLAALFPVDDAPAEIVWTLELNLLRTERDLVLAPDTGGPSPPLAPMSPFGGIRFPVGDLVMSTDGSPPAPSNVRETRVRLAGGQVTLRVPTHLVARADLLQAWLDFDVARTALAAQSDEAPLAALLPTQLGQDLLRTAIAPLTSRTNLRASPVTALGGNLAPQYVSAMGLGAMQARHVVHRRPQGGEVLSLAFTFGSDAGGAISQLQPFIGRRNFAFHVMREVFAPVIKARWKLRPAAHQFVGNTPLEMPLHEGTEELGQGEVRVRVRLADELSDVALMALVSAQGDVVRLACDQEIQLLAAWYANGDPVEDLGDLGTPQTLPFVVNCQPFTPAPPEETRDTPLRDFLLSVLEPLAVPLIDRYAIGSLDGFISEALGASVAWWSFPTRSQEVTGGLNTVLAAQL